MLGSIRSRSASPPAKSQFFKQHKASQDGKVIEGKQPEYGDPQFVCIKVGHLEFFAKAALFARHSQYFSKMQQNI